jgi:6-phosphogluconolactonase
VSAARLVVADGDAFAPTAAAWIAARIEAAVRARGVCALALAGGTTPEPVYRALAEGFGALPWEHVELFFGDERCVPPDHAESNFRMVQRTLVARLPRDAEHARPVVHRMRGEASDPDLAAREYEQALPDPLDLVILGLGEDGHTASLFPGSPAFERVGQGERGARRVLAVRGPKPPAARLTIAPSVIEGARDVLVLVRGAGKAARLAEVLRGPLDPVALPAQLARGGTWMVDREAAAEMERTGSNDTRSAR